MRDKTDFVSREADRRWRKDKGLGYFFSCSLAVRCAVALHGLATHVIMMIVLAVDLGRRKRFRQRRRALDRVWDGHWRLLERYRYDTFPAFDHGLLHRDRTIAPVEPVIHSCILSAKTASKGAYLGKKSPHALQIGWPNWSRRQSGVTVVPQF